MSVTDFETYVDNKTIESFVFSRAMKFSYVKTNGNESEVRTVRPLGRPYQGRFTGYDYKRKALRSFRVERMSDVELVEFEGDND